jgi:hypothetical protein
MRRDVVWRSLQWPGIERLVVETDGTGVTAAGLLVARVDGAPVAALYEIHCDPAWQVDRVAVEVPGRADRLELSRDPRGAWTANGRALPGLAGCVDVDLSLSPFTNTLPVRRLGLAGGQAADLDVAYITLPDLAVTPARQRYTCLARDAHGGRYRYESGAFAAEVAVDADGLVTTYEGLWERPA